MAAYIRRGGIGQVEGADDSRFVFAECRNRVEYAHRRRLNAAGIMIAVLTLQEAFELYRGIAADDAAMNSRTAGRGGGPHRPAPPRPARKRGGDALTGPRGPGRAG